MEGKAQLGSIGHSGPIIFRKIRCLDAHDDILLLRSITRSGMEVHFTSHELRDLYSTPNCVLSIVLENNALWPNTQNHIAALLALSRQFCRHLRRKHSHRAKTANLIAARNLFQLSLKEIHLRRANKAGHKQIHRGIKHLLRGADLLDKAILIITIRSPSVMASV